MIHCMCRVARERYVHDAIALVVGDAQIVNLANETSTCNNFPDYPIAMAFATGAIVSKQPIICGGRSGFKINYSESLSKYLNMMRSR